MTPAEIPPPPVLTWTENGEPRSARWRSESGAAPPRRVVVADDTMTADTAFRMASEGTGLLWRGDFQNARQLLQALARRIDARRVDSQAANGRRKAKDKSARASMSDPAAVTLDGMPAAAARAAATTTAGAAAEFPQAFHLHRQARAQRARTLGMLLLPFDSGHVVPLRRAPDVAQACAAVYGRADEPYVASLRELLGAVGAQQWHEKGVPIAALDGRIHPSYGVYSPVRGEYLALLAQAALPPGCARAFDIGTGTGVIAALLARRGVARITATDQDPRALACAHENLQRLGLVERVQVLKADLFPPGQAELIVCNPPWVPARPSAPVEHAIYDPDSRMLRGFLQGLAPHLAPQGEGWLILSDLAEHLGLRTRDELLGWIAAAGLRVADRLDARPQHPKAMDPLDPLHAARSREMTSLWRLRAA